MCVVVAHEYDVFVQMKLIISLEIWNVICDVVHMIAFVITRLKILMKRETESYRFTSDDPQLLDGNMYSCNIMFYFVDLPQQVVFC